MARGGSAKSHIGPHKTSYSPSSGGDDDLYPIDTNEKEERPHYVCGICGAGTSRDDGLWEPHRGYSSIELKELEEKAFMICRPCRKELIRHIEARRVEKEYYKVLYQRLVAEE